MFKKINSNIIFFIKLIFFIGIIIGYINNILPQYSKGYDASLIDKVSRLKSINKPKIVLLGNSNLSFGIDSEFIEKSLGMPVVNMGLHGSAGNAFHEEMSKLNVCKGDIYIVCHINYADNDTIEDGMVVWSAIENHFELWKILRYKDIKTMVEFFPVYLKKSLNLYATGKGNIDNGGVYSRSAFNEYGDITLYRENIKNVFEDIVDIPTVNKITTRRLNKLQKYLDKKGAFLLVAGFPIMSHSVNGNIKKFEKFQKNLERKLDAQVISNYKDYIFEENYFYDGYPHLTTEGTKIRTKQLVSDIQKWQKQNGYQ